MQILHITFIFQRRLSTQQHKLVVTNLIKYFSDLQQLFRKQILNFWLHHTLNIRKVLWKHKYFPSLETFYRQKLCKEINLSQPWYFLKTVLKLLVCIKKCLSKLLHHHSILWHCSLNCLLRFRMLWRIFKILLTLKRRFIFVIILEIIPATWKRTLNILVTLFGDYLTELCWRW